MLATQFTIQGNQENKKGNPIPYHRTTQGSFWNKSSKRYKAWKEYVREQYAQAHKSGSLPEVKPTLKDGPEPIKGKVKGTVQVHIYFAGENHADPDNIVKGINDALFENDKHVDVVTTHQCHEKVGKVEVNIVAYGEQKA